MHNYWEDAVCPICGRNFTQDEFDNRHSWEEGQDIHADCCPQCNPRGTVATVTIEVIARTADADEINNLLPGYDLETLAEGLQLALETDGYTVELQVTSEATK
jgi:hypothetical protein